MPTDPKSYSIQPFTARRNFLRNLRVRMPVVGKRIHYQNFIFILFNFDFQQSDLYIYSKSDSNRLERRSQFCQSSRHCGNSLVRPVDFQRFIFRLSYAQRPIPDDEASLDEIRRRWIDIRNELFLQSMVLALSSYDLLRIRFHGRNCGHFFAILRFIGGN